MIDFGSLRKTPRVPEREVQELAQAWVNEPGMQAVALRIARLCHVPPGEPFNVFRGELAVLAAEQYLQGRATGRAGIVTLPELPRRRVQ